VSVKPYFVVAKNTSSYSLSCCGIDARGTDRRRICKVFSDSFSNLRNFKAGLE